MLAEAKQRKEEEQKQEEAKLRAQEAKLKSDKWLAPPLKRSAPFDRQYRWSSAGGIRAVGIGRLSPTDADADVENKRVTRNKTQARNSINERAERAKKRGSVEERPNSSSEEDEEEDEVSG